MSCSDGGDGGGTPTEVALNVTLNGEGTGTVTSTPAGIDCGSDCEADFEQDAAVTLQAVPGPNSTFGSWNGACAAFDQNTTCQLTMDADKNVTATFNLSGDDGDDGETGGDDGETMAMTATTARPVMGMTEMMANPAPPKR